MHASVLAWVPKALTAEEVTGKRVIEAGSYDVNGSARPYIESLNPTSYTGIDMRPGPRVDMVMDAADIPAQLGENCADIVASFEMLEHAPDWVAALAGLIEAVAEDGILVITTRSEGFPYHDFGGDYWRFPVDAMGTIITAAGLDVERLEADPEPGVFVKARKPVGWVWPPGVADAWQSAGVTPMVQP